MKLSDGLGSEPEDVEVVRRVGDHADAIDRALPVISGPDIRGALGVTSSSTKVERSRTPFLAAAAAVVVAGGIAATTLGRGGTDTQLEATPFESAEVESTDQTIPVPPPETTEPEGGPSELDAADMMPIPVAAADFGTAEVRFLPPSDSGFAVASGSRVLLSRGSLEPAVATPTRTQRLAMPTIDPADRRSVLVIVSNYADEAEADAVVEAEPTPGGLAGESADIGGRQGSWHEDEGFAPFSAGNPMRTIRTLRVRLDPTTVLDVVAPDVSRAEIEALVASLTFSDDGSLEKPTPLAGFVADEPIDGWSPSAAIIEPSASDYLSLVLVGVNGEQVDLTISAESAGLSAVGAHFDDDTGYGWIEAGPFRETTVSFVGEHVTLVLRSYDGQVSADELVELARSIQPVNDEVWVERLAIATLFDAPVADVGDVPIED